MSKRQIKTFFAVTIIVLSIFGIIFSDNSSKLSSPFKTIHVSEESEQTITDEQVIGSSDSEIPSSVSIVDESSNEDEIATENIEESTNKTYKVIKVIDGDTLDVSLEDITERLRLIGIDTAETVDPR